jgi:tetratricopeptide (TPR) repeat protein
MHIFFIRLSSILIINISILSIRPLSGKENAQAASDSEPLSQQLQYELARGDTAAAMQLLDRALEKDADHAASRLWRGKLHLAAGDYDSAKEDFTKALHSKSPETRARAHVGLGHILIRNPNKTSQATKHYRLAVKIDPTCFEYLFDPAHVGFWLSGLAGKKIASEALARLICLDPLYENAYRVWRDLALDKRENEIREVDKRLEVFLEAYPDSASWRVDLAMDRFYLGETSLALETLNEMARANPDYISADIPLLRARCYLETGDTKAFHDYYQQALLIAKSTDDFTRLFRQAEPLFYPEAYLSWEKCLTGESRAEFFLQFWGALKPDPLDSVNPRLATHYFRLRLAEKEHGLQLPNIPCTPSLAMSFPKNIMSLIRHGAKRNKRNGQSRTQKNPGTIINPLKFWYIGYSETLDNFTQKAPGMISNMMNAIRMQYDQDTNILHSNILAYTRFRSPKKGNIEIELYQGGISGSGSKPKAEIAVFDLAWKELGRKESKVYPADEYSKEQSWLSVHSFEIPPGTYRFGIRTCTTEGVKWVERGQMDVHEFSERTLDISGAVLGSLPKDNVETYSRKDIAMVPRPSLRFKHGEIISVFLEVYNLGQDRMGSRSYTVEVDVTLVKDDTEKVSDFAGGTIRTRNLDPGKSSTSLNHIFERTPETYTDPVAEFFTIDTSQLRPGNYRMVIKINDISNNSSKETSCIFELGE